MGRKMVVGGGAAAVLLSVGALIGGVTTRMVGAQTSQSAQTAAGQTSNRGTEAEGSDTPVSLPAGSASQDAANRAAVAYIQQTAPYNAQGLSATKVTTDSENGTAVYKVEFRGTNNQGAEVTVSPQGTVLKAEADTDAETADDGPTGAAGVAGSPAPSPSLPAGTGTLPH